MCMNAGQVQTPSGMRPALTTSGMHCQGQVSGTQVARQAALAQPEPQTQKKAFRPLLCVGNYQLC